MKELNDVKSVLRDVLSFVQRLDPGCLFRTIVDPGYLSVQINIERINDWAVSSFLKYFKFLTKNTARWTSDIDCRILMHFTSGCPQVNSEIQFYFKAKEIPQFFLTDGSKLTNDTLCPIDLINLD
jgi:hypothetical protein